MREVGGRSPAQDCCRAVLKLAFPMFLRFRAWGVGNVPRRGGVLLVSNHQSFFDPLLVGVPLPWGACYMARRTLFDVPGFGWCLWAVNAFPVERGGVDRRAMRTAEELLSRGGALVVFPEGTRTPDGQVKPFKAGFALIAARAGVPIVPVAISGAFEAWPRHRRLPRARRVHVAYGEPVPAPGAAKGACREAAEDVWRRVVALEEELRQKE